ncbi:MAG: YceI family protein [Candidatus Peribacteria bacterium]|nr:MAG: YceI family protein [Candidatus Peribacteria bacterium]
MLSSADIWVDKGKDLVGGTLVIDMNSLVSVVDPNKSLDAMLKSPEYFDTEKYPTAEFNFL